VIYHNPASTSIFVLKEDVPPKVRFCFNAAHFFDFPHLVRLTQTKKNNGKVFIDTAWLGKISSVVLGGVMFRVSALNSS
jgi:hypothetical protein